MNFICSLSILFCYVSKSLYLLPIFCPSESLCFSCSCDVSLDDVIIAPKTAILPKGLNIFNMHVEAIVQTFRPLIHSKPVKLTRICQLSQNYSAEIILTPILSNETKLQETFDNNTKDFIP